RFPRHPRTRALGTGRRGTRRYPSGGLHALRGTAHRPGHLWTLALHPGRRAGTPTSQAGSGHRRWSPLDLATGGRALSRRGAACKTVVSTRAKRSGMRWTPEGLDALLPLRTAVLNGSYDPFWEGRSAVLT